jgi:hypothetical protein
MGLNYAQVLTKMCLGTKKEEFGNPVMKRKVSASGACFLELAGPTNEANKQADVLAEKLRQIFPAETIKVARPVKKLDVRLVGLDDAAGPSEVAEAVAKVCDASAAHIKCSVVSVDAAGARCARVSLPVAAAKTLLAKR